MKEKMVALPARPIAKVAEAHASKNQKVKSKLTSAKRNPHALASSSEISDLMKLKKISQA
jgi:predicted flap endonuclease-1-like 5' DNA nuclease